MNEQVYIKNKNSQYQKIGPSDGWDEFESSGVWLVSIKNGKPRLQCVRKLLDLPTSYRPSKLKLKQKVITNSIKKYFKEKEAELQKYKRVSYGTHELVDKITKNILNNWK